MGNHRIMGCCTLHPELGVTYLGSQGDVWDAQKDIAAALYGALICVTILAVIRGVPGTLLPVPGSAGYRRLIYVNEGWIEALGRAESRSTHLLSGLFLWYGLLWTWLAIGPVNRRDWLLENLLAFALVLLLTLTYRRFQLSTLSLFA